MRRTVSSVIGSISGLMLPDGSSDPCTCSRLIFTSMLERQACGNRWQRRHRVRTKDIFKDHIWKGLQCSRSGSTHNIRDISKQKIDHSFSFSEPSDNITT